MSRSWRSGGGIIVFSLTIFGILFSFSSRGVGATGVAHVTDGAISGRVMSASGTPVVNASLSLLSESHVVLTTTADAEGRFRFDHLAPGRYRLDAAGLGFVCGRSRRDGLARPGSGGTPDTAPHRPGAGHGHWAPEQRRNDPRVRVFHR